MTLTPTENASLSCVEKRSAKNLYIRITVSVGTMIVTLIHPAIRGNLPQLESRMVMFSIIAAAMLILFSIAGVWSIGAFFMFSASTRFLTNVRGSTVSPYLWVVELLVFTITWAPVMHQMALRRCDAMLGDDCGNAPTRQAQRYLIPSYACILILIPFFGIFIPEAYMVSRDEIVQNLVIGICLGCVLGLMTNEAVLDNVLMLAVPAVAAFVLRRRGFSAYTFTSMVFLGSLVTSCIRRSPLVFESHYR